MANGYNPYGIASTQQGLLESLLGTEQAEKTGATALGKQKGEMGEEFQEEMIASQKEQERLLNKQRKGGFLEKLLPLAGMFMGPLGSAITSGLSGMYGAKKGSDFAKGQIELARGAGLSDKWGKTFLGKDARTVTGETESMLDKMKMQADLSGGDLLKTGLASGISGYAMGKTGEGIMEGIGGAKLSKTPGIQEMDIAELDKLGAGKKFLGVGKGFGDYTSEELGKLISQDAPYLKAIFGQSGLGKDPTTLLEEGGEGSSVLQNLLMMLQLTGGGR